MCESVCLSTGEGQTHTHNAVLQHVALDLLLGHSVDGLLLKAGLKCAVSLTHSFLPVEATQRTTADQVPTQSV